jgi:N4-gp56 family major capsid protein
MANTFNDVLTNANMIGTIFSGITVKPLRPKYIFDDLCKERVWAMTGTPKRGDALSFPVLSSYSANTAAMDPTTVTPTSDQRNTYTRRTVTLEAYGRNSIVDLYEYEPESFLDNVVGDLVFNLSDQGMNSLNDLAKAAIDLNKYSNETSGTLSGTYHYYGSQGTASSMGELKAIDVRQIIADLKGDNVTPFADGFYMGVIHPLVATQLRAQTGNDAWRIPHAYAQPNEIWTGEIGEFEGVRWVANNQVTGAGTGTISCYVLGQEGCGKGIGKDLQVGTDPKLWGKFNNLLNMFWTALVGYKIIRREAIRIIETTNTNL